MLISLKISNQGWEDPRDRVGTGPRGDLHRQVLLYVLNQCLSQVSKQASREVWDKGRILGIPSMVKDHIKESL